jgi:hypothetical protein
MLKEVYGEGGEMVWDYPYSISCVVCIDYIESIQIHTDTPTSIRNMHNPRPETQQKEIYEIRVTIKILQVFWNVT